MLVKSLEVHDRLCFSKSAGVGLNRQVELNFFIIPILMILKPNTLENFTLAVLEFILFDAKDDTFFYGYFPSLHISL